MCEASASIYISAARCLYHIACWTSIGTWMYDGRSKRVVHLTCFFRCFDEKMVRLKRECTTVVVIVANRLFFCFCFSSPTNTPSLKIVHDSTQLTVLPHYSRYHGTSVYTLNGAQIINYISCHRGYNPLLVRGKTASASASATGKIGRPRTNRQTFLQS